VLDYPERLARRPRANRIGKTWSLRVQPFADLASLDARPAMAGGAHFIMGSKPSLIISSVKGGGSSRLPAKDIYDASDCEQG
jgi:hypothetical protein